MDKNTLNQRFNALCKRKNEMRPAFSNGTEFMQFEDYNCKYLNTERKKYVKHDKNQLELL